jgi:putative acetyltransferase
MEIRIDDLRGPEIAALLDEHLADMYRISPPESVHALDLEALRAPDITFWTLWQAQELAGCIALKQHSPEFGEIKSMRTSNAFRGQGLAPKLLHHLIDKARLRGLQRLSLETGTEPFFAPARQLYIAFGFTECPPFATYIEDPNSLFMTRVI